MAHEPNGLVALGEPSAQDDNEHRHSWLGHLHLRRNVLACRAAVLGQREGHDGNRLGVGWGSASDEVDVLVAPDQGLEVGLAGVTAVLVAEHHVQALGDQQALHLEGDCRHGRLRRAVSVLAPRAAHHTLGEQELIGNTARAQLLDAFPAAAGDWPGDRSHQLHRRR